MASMPTTTTEPSDEKSGAVVRGSCLCQAIRFEITAPLNNNVLCFCNSCRKATGSVGMANSFCEKSNFRLITGETSLRIYEDRSCDSGGTIHRRFCAQCGSTMWSENRLKLPGVYIVPFGALDVDPAAAATADRSWAAPSMEFFVKRKAPWFETAEGAKKFDEQPSF